MIFLFRQRVFLFFCVLAVLPLTAQNGLRDLAAPKKVFVGNIISNAHLDNPSAFRNGEADAHLREEYNAVVLENYMKMSFVLPGSEPAGIHDLTVDQLRATLTQNNIEQFLNRPEWAGLRKRGHAMIWFSQAPGWLNSSGPSWTGQQVFEFSRKYIFALGQICGNQVDEWDVINEAISDQSPGGQRVWRESTWYRRANDGSMTDWGVATYENYIKMLFVWAREAQPEARLYYNDYSIERFNPSSASKNGFMRQKFKALRECGAPIDGIGFQSHFVLSNMVNTSGVINQGFIDGIEATMQDLDAAGLDVAITELDIRICNGNRSEAFQEVAFRELAAMALTQPNCRELLIWGLRDEDNWITLLETPPFNGCQDAVIAEGGSYAPKAGYTGMATAIAALPDRDAFGFAGLNPGNGAPADCGGDGSQDPFISFVSGPTSISPGEEITVSVGYVATGDQDVFVTLQFDSNPFTVFSETITDVVAGVDTIDVVFEVPADAPSGVNRYQYQTYITPDGGNFSTRFGDFAQTNVTMLGEDTQLVVSSAGPDVVERGDTAVVDVVYKAGEGQQIVIWFQLDENPFTVFQEFRMNVAPGDGEVAAKLFIPFDVPLAVDDYQFQTILVPAGGGWEERISNIDQRNVDVVMRTGVDDGTFGGLALRVYPNPTRGMINVELPAGSSQTNYSVYSTIGQRVATGTLARGTQFSQVDLTDLPGGMYVLLFQRDGMTGRVRIRKE